MTFLHEICGAWVQADDVGSTFTLVEPATCGLLYDPSNPSQIPYWQSLGKRPSISIKSGYLAVGAPLHMHQTSSNNGPARWLEPTQAENCLLLPNCCSFEHPGSNWWANLHAHEVWPGLTRKPSQDTFGQRSCINKNAFISLDFQTLRVSYENVSPAMGRLLALNQSGETLSLRSHGLAAGTKDGSREISTWR